MMRFVLKNMKTNGCKAVEILKTDYTSEKIKNTN